jgi:hypothetical protein
MAMRGFPCPTTHGKSITIFLLTTSLSDVFPLARKAFGVVKERLKRF